MQISTLKYLCKNIYIWLENTTVANQCMLSTLTFEIDDKVS